MKLNGKGFIFLIPLLALYTLNLIRTSVGHLIYWLDAHGYININDRVPFPILVAIYGWWFASRHSNYTWKMVRGDIILSAALLGLIAAILGQPEIGIAAAGIATLGA